MGILSTILSILKVIGGIWNTVSSLFHDHVVRQAQEVSDELDNAKGDLHEIDTAQRARDAVPTDADSVRGPDSDAAKPGQDNIS